MNKFSKRLGISAAALLAVLAADRVTKRLAVSVLSGGAKVFIPGVLGWRYAENTGAAFSALSGSGLLLILLTAALIIAAIVWYLRHGDCNRWLAAGVTLIVAGGLGNLYDRLTLGYVIDFIEVLFVRFAIFNFADVCICCGAVLAAVGFVLAEKREKEGNGVGGAN